MTTPEKVLVTITDIRQAILTYAPNWCIHTRVAQVRPYWYQTQTMLDNEHMLEMPMVIDFVVTVSRDAGEKQSSHCWRAPLHVHQTLWP